MRELYASGKLNPFWLGKRRSVETRIRISTSLRGREHSTETKRKIGEASRGRRHSLSTIVLLSEKKRKMYASGELRPTHVRQFSKEGLDKISKEYFVVNPDGVRFRIRNLAEFCRQTCLDENAMYWVANGRRLHYNGWKCTKV